MFSQQLLTIWIDDHWMFLMKDYIVLEEEKRNGQLKTQPAK